MQFHSERLSCQLVTEADRQDFCALYQDPKVMRKIGPAMTEEAANRWFDTVVKRNQQPAPRQRVWRIGERGCGQFVGIQSLKWGLDSNSNAEIGIILKREANGKGLAEEGMGALVDFGFLHLGLKSIFAEFDTTNYATEKFVKKLGFTVNEAFERNKIQVRACTLNFDSWDRKQVAFFESGILLRAASIS